MQFLVVNRRVTANIFGHTYDLQPIESPSAGLRDILVADKASAWIEQAEAGAKYRFLDQRCQQYMRAKARCDSGLAGVCEICGRKIDPERLRVMVDATTCVSCKKRAQQRLVGRTQLGFACGL